MYKVGARRFLRHAMAFVADGEKRKGYTETAMANPFLRDRLDKHLNAAQASLQLLLKDDLRISNNAFISKFAYAYQRLVQFPLDVIAYNAAIDNYLAKNPKASIADAETAADLVIRDTMGSNTALDISTIESGTNSQQMVLLFANFFITWGNLLRTEFANANTGSVSERTVKMAYIYTMLYALPVFTTELIGRAMRNKWPEEEDADEWEEIVTTFVIEPQLKTAIAMVPFLSYVQPLWGSLTESPFDDRTQAGALSILETYGRTIKNTFEWVATDKEVGEDIDASQYAKNLSITIGAVLGIPLGQFVGNPASYLANEAEGEEDGNAVGLVTGATPQK
jgi:hypothetical protein